MRCFWLVYRGWLDFCWFLFLLCISLNFIFSFLLWILFSFVLTCLPSLFILFLNCLLSHLRNIFIKISSRFDRIFIVHFTLSILLHPCSLFIRIVISLGLISKIILFNSLSQKFVFPRHIILIVYLWWSFSVLFDFPVMFCLFGVLIVELLDRCESLDEHF